LGEAKKNLGMFFLLVRGGGSGEKRFPPFGRGEWGNKNRGKTSTGPYEEISRGEEAV